MKFKEIYNKIIDNAERVKQLGEWPQHKSIESLTSRIPQPEQKAPGFDAGIACALDLIPRSKQRLAAILHGNYTPQAIEQVQREISEIELDSFLNTETCWWLLGCYFCAPGGQTQEEFIRAINRFKYIADENLQQSFAIAEWDKVKNSFMLIDGVALALEDGGMQAAYAHGHRLAIQPMHGIWFVGTFLESLGIPDNFEWETDKDEQGREKSGPVFGSKQFVKCATFDELNAVLNWAKKHVES